MLFRDIEPTVFGSSPVRTPAVKLFSIEVPTPVESRSQWMSVLDCVKWLLQGSTSASPHTIAGAHRHIILQGLCAQEVLLGGPSMARSRQAAEVLTARSVGSREVTRLRIPLANRTNCACGCAHRLLDCVPPTPTGPGVKSTGCGGAAADAARKNLNPSKANLMPNVSECLSAEAFTSKPARIKPGVSVTRPRTIRSK